MTINKTVEEERKETLSSILRIAVENAGRDRTIHRFNVMRDVLKKAISDTDEETALYASGIETVLVCIINEIRERY